MELDPIPTWTFRMEDECSQHLRLSCRCSPFIFCRWRVVSDLNSEHCALISVYGSLWAGGRGVFHIGTVLNQTAMDWSFQLDQPCQSMAMDPNDANHMLVNNASNGAHIYESTDGGKTFHGCLNYRGAVMVAIDRTGWHYVGSEGGIYRNMNDGHSTQCTTGKWEAYYDRRIARRPPHGVRDKVPHDFQGINREEKIWKYDITKANGAFEVEERNVESQPGSGVTVNYYTLKAKS